MQSTGALESISQPASFAHFSKTVLSIVEISIQTSITNFFSCHQYQEEPSACLPAFQKVPESLNSVIAITEFCGFDKSLVITDDLELECGNSSVITVELESSKKLQFS